MFAEDRIFFDYDRERNREINLEIDFEFSEEEYEKAYKHRKAVAELERRFL